MGYYDADYEPKDTDILCRVPDHATARRRPDRGRGGRRRRVLDGDLDGGLDRPSDRPRALPGEGLRGRPGARARGQYIAHIAYDLDLFEEGSIANLTISIIGNVFGFKALQARCASRTCGSRRTTSRRSRDRRTGSSWSGSTWTSTAGRCSARPSNPSWACQRRTTAGSCTRRCVAGWTSPRTTRTSTRSRSCAGAIVSCTAIEGVNRASAATGEVKGHYMNVTAATMEEMYERAEFAKELGSVIIMMDLTVGYTAMQSMSKWARRNGLILHLHRAGHGTYTRQKTHGVSFRVIAKWCRLLGVDHIHAGTVVGKLEGDPDDDPGLLRHPPPRPRAAESRARHLLRSGLGIAAGRDAGRLRRYSRRPDAPAAALPGRGRGAAVRRRHDRPSRWGSPLVRPPTASRSRR